MGSDCPTTPLTGSENAQLLSPSYHLNNEPRANLDPPYGYVSRRPPPVFVEQQDRRGLYEIVSSPDDRENHTDPYERQDDNDNIPLFHLRNRPTGDKKRYSTVLPSTPLPRGPVPPGLAGGTGWMERFEPTPIIPLIIHTLLCIAAFPLIFYLSPKANGLSVFWARVIVGAIAGALGLSLSVSLMDLARRGIEAALWATIIHESMSGDTGGVTLSQLNYHTANPVSPWAAILLLYRRWFKHRGTGRSRRKDYDDAPWSLYIVLFLFTAAISGSLAFGFGRVVDIYTGRVMQTQLYDEVKVIGDLSSEDIARAEYLNSAFKGYKHTWSIIPFSATANLPKDRSFKVRRSSGSGVEDALHFAEVYTGQVINRTGFGTFFENTTAVWTNASSPANTTTLTTAVEGMVPIGEGAILRWPRWGERVVCQTMEEMPGNGLIIDPKRNTQNNLTYGYVTKAAVHGLLDYAEISNKSLAQLPPINFASYLDPGDEPPAGVMESDVAMMGKWSDNGVAHQFKSEALDRGEPGHGWTMLEIVLIRLNESYAPQSQFPQYVPGGDAISRTRIGIDAALCVSEIRPHILDAYHNAAGLPTTRNFVEEGDVFTVPDKNRKGKFIQDVQRGLKSTGKWLPFSNAHTNARNMIIKDNGRDFYHVSNPTVVSFTGGFGPDNYTKLLAAELQDALADADSQHLLPYLVGSQPIVARGYTDDMGVYLLHERLLV
ncbi:unnamed protein product [Rhizoctonia solani]|uniref:Uncharacterized protein n=1 Tax=Rhizoctonia solani TaxID=456999 RepID=A0A8H3GEP3_9AGAM|nr:unnamed protein product [Rhizoctonia solani]